MNITQVLRPPIRDARILTISEAKLSGSLSNAFKTPVDPKFSRAFSWFPNSAVPTLLQPLLKFYIEWTREFLSDPRDTIFVTHILFGLCTTVPSTLYLLYSFSWIHAVLHTVSLVVTIPPFILMLHCVWYEVWFNWIVIRR